MLASFKFHFLMSATCYLIVTIFPFYLIDQVKQGFTTTNVGDPQTFCKNFFLALEIDENLKLNRITSFAKRQDHFLQSCEIFLVKMPIIIDIVRENNYIIFTVDSEESIYIPLHNLKLFKFIQNNNKRVICVFSEVSEFVKINFVWHRIFFFFKQCNRLLLYNFQTIKTGYSVFLGTEAD